MMTSTRAKQIAEQYAEEELEEFLMGVESQINGRARRGEYSVYIKNIPQAMWSKTVDKLAELGYGLTVNEEVNKIDGNNGIFISWEHW